MTTTHVYPDPEAAVYAYLDSLKALWPAGTSYSTSFPTAAIAAPHIQFAWDGPQGEDERRESCMIRVTVWTPQGQRTAAKDLASLVRAKLLQLGSVSVWRVTRGAGRAPGIDPGTDLPFVTFTVNAETKPFAVA